MSKPLIAFFSALVLVSAAGPTSAPAATTQALPGDKLPEAVRRALGHRMVHHAQQLGELLKAVLILDHAAVEERVGALIESKLARPAAGETDTLNSSIPKRFFDLQDNLVKQATAVREAAHQGDDAKMGEAFGKLAQACVACHAVYLWQSSDEAH
jgi:cytochrome c556